MYPARVSEPREPEGPAQPAQGARPPSRRRGGKPRQRRRGVYRMRCLRMPPDRHPEPGVQVGKVNQASGSSDARRSHQPGDVPSPCSMSIGSRKYKARRAPQTVWIVGPRWRGRYTAGRKSQSNWPSWPSAWSRRRIRSARRGSLVLPLAASGMGALLGAALAAFSSWVSS